MKKDSRSKLGRWSHAGALGVMLSACSSGHKPPAEPDPVLVDDGTPSSGQDNVAPASTAQVKQGRDAIQAGDFERAVTILQEAVATDPKDPQAAFYLGVAFEGAGDLGSAEREYERAVQLSPELLEARVNLSYLLLDQDKAEQSLAVSTAGLELEPKQPALLANRALALDVLGKPEAFGAYEALLREVPEDAANRFNYAVLLAAAERKDESLAQLAKIKSQDAPLLLDVAQLYGRLEAYDACVTVLDGLVAAGKSAEVLVHRARCRHSAGDDPGAEKDLREAVSLEPKNPIGHYYLGRHLVALGKRAEGRKFLEEAVQLGPETPFGKAASRDLASGK